MIDAEIIERAERMLGMVYADQSLDRQLSAVQVDVEAFDNFIATCRAMVRRRQPDLDPRLEPTFNTAFGHAFLVGLIAGRDETVGIQ